MIYKVISKPEFKKFVDGLIQQNQTFGPKLADVDIHNKPIYRFEEVHSFDEMDLDYTLSYASIKNFFLPFREQLSRFKISKDDWTQHIEYAGTPRVLVGVRPCDINGLIKLDNIFAHGTFPSPYYIARRKNTFLIGMDHEPLEDCFCHSLNQDLLRDGFQLFCSDIGDSYYLTINSSKAFKFLKNVQAEDPNREHDKAFIERRKFLQSAFKTHVDVTGLPHFLDIEFKSPIWNKWGDKCLSCGTCAMVCPSCYCYSIEENIDVNLGGSTRERVQYSCNLVDFAEVAGGHNFRPLREDRLKYRYYHHYRGFTENADEQICVGCNRCGRACLAGINPKDVINDLRLETADDLQNT